MSPRKYLAKKNIGYGINRLSVDKYLLFIFSQQKLIENRQILLEDNLLVNKIFFISKLKNYSSAT